MNKNLIIGLVVVALIAIGGYFFPKAGNALLGGTTNFDAVDVTDGYYVDAAQVVSGAGAWIGSILTTESVVTGGDACTLTDANGGTYTMSATELQNCSYFKFAAGGAGQAVIALTMPATSTLSTYLPTAGQCQEYVYDATALAVATTTTFTAGTGWNLFAYTTNDDVIDGLETSSWKICRDGSSDLYWKVSEDVAAD